MSDSADMSIGGETNVTNPNAATMSAPPSSAVAAAASNAAGAAANANAANVVIPKCVCTWKNCRVYQKTFRDLHHPYWDGVIKLKFAKGDAESMALKNSMDRILKVAPATSEGALRYTIARHHYTEVHMKKFIESAASSDPRTMEKQATNFFLKPFTVHGAKKYLASVDPTFTLKGEKGEVLYLQVPNNTKENVKATYMKLKGGPAGPAAPTPPPAQQQQQPQIQQQQQPQAQPAPATVPFASQSAATAPQYYPQQQQQAVAQTQVQSQQQQLQQHQLLHQKELENVKLKEQLESMQLQLTFLHDMVRKLQEAHLGPPNNTGGSLSNRGGTGAGYYASNPNGGSTRSRQTLSSHSRSAGGTNRTIPQEIELEGDDPRGGGPGGAGRPAGGTADSGEQDWSERDVDYGYGDDGGAGGAGGFGPRKGRSMVRRGSMSSVVSQARSIVSASRSIKSLPREIEMDEDDDDSETHESLEEEAFENRSVVSSKYGGGGSARDSGGVRAVQAAAGAAAAADPTNSRKPARQGSFNGSNAPGSGDAGSQEGGGSAGTKGSYQVTALVVKDPYGEQGSYSGSISKSTNMPHGYGRLEYDQAGRWYEGDWKHGRWTGHGRLSNGDGDFYEGGLKNDHKHGRGIMKFADGRIFEGEYVNGQMLEGKMTYQDGSTYMGTWLDGMRHGKGRCHFTDDSIYEGEFREGEFFGMGKMTWSDGGWYEGSWVYGEMDGLGKEVRPDGSVRHEGMWRKGQPIRNR